MNYILILPNCVHYRITVSSNQYDHELQYIDYSCVVINNFTIITGLKCIYTPSGCFCINPPLATTSLEMSLKY